ncbi:MAG: mismatch-specific DNA-glycosylase [Acidimicrobiia bacterium]|nr:mismatch-specific DNA-glycosylase [Acidimicrobiia bacterium]
MNPPDGAAAEWLPLALAHLHRRTSVGAVASVRISASLRDAFARVPDLTFDDLCEGAGFEWCGAQGTEVELRRRRSLADTVGPAMAVLVCGLNPSLHAADAGVGYCGPGNRFWPAARASGLLRADRDPIAALVADGVGMTDLVKRASAAADVLADDEYRHGLRRLDRLVGWLAPTVVAVVGLTGWRVAVDRSAQPGLQARRLRGRPVYVLPSTSGRNARTSFDALVEHLRTVHQVAAAHTR